MDIQIRPCASVDEVRHAMAPIRHYFGRSAPNEDQAERFTRVLPPERIYAAWEGSRAVGGLGAFPFELTVPGGRVPAAGVTVAGVLPTHRRRGVLRAMMRDLLDACHRRGEPVAYLWATEDTIYGRFGFGLASFTGEIDLPRERSAFHAPFAASARARLVPLAVAEEYLAPIYERVAAVTRECLHGARHGGRPESWPIRIGGGAGTEIYSARYWSTEANPRPTHSIG